MKSFLQGRKPLGSTSLPSTAAGPALHRVVKVSPPPDHAHGPQVEVIKEGDKVVRLIVTCSCGERTEVDCIYGRT